MAQTETVLYTFQALPNASSPLGGVVRDAAGNLYGTTLAGGTNNAGAVFKLDTHGNQTVIYSFAGGSDGSVPSAALVRDAVGNLYGTTRFGGGTANLGTVFKIDATGKETILHSFLGGVDGENPTTSLILDRTGNLYGTSFGGGNLSATNCQFGGISGCGYVYKIAPGGKRTVLYKFKGGSDGRAPQGPLTMDTAGNLYGVTLAGGPSEAGTVFKLSKSGAEAVLHAFEFGAAGGLPSGRLAIDSAGNLYGTTQGGGDEDACFQFGCGTAFKIDPNGNLTTLHTFTDSGATNDAVQPSQGLVRDAAGNLYGTSTAGGIGGIFGNGTVFKIDANGNETVLYRFTGGTDGSTPWGTVLIAPNGNLYGTTETGGDIDIEGGVIFVIKP